MLIPEDLGPAKRLLAALRHRAPKLVAEIVRDEETGLPQVQITYRDGVMLAVWDGTAYRWRSEEGPWEVLPQDPRDAAAAIAPPIRVTTPARPTEDGEDPADDKRP
ncbi:hypothetical protein BZB76_4982 [Actinomadura pelletieri DSM 43383]|uniref:Uncharacterized protein n=1 Tax=Actinomadura pelletieri DSM 43383 TaxID=1120940 RepID=A0A495QJ13_9ACTN|nr:hypothetical protein [Actinomadura pelletieri]RKS72165.1 hypothetical protein BZB76_4982 [Actinomadura pelletieri DSM 43383]